VDPYRLWYTGGGLYLVAYDHVMRAIRTFAVERTYAYTCAIRAVHSEDGMTADWVPAPLRSSHKISSRIVNEIRGHQPRRL
jgi:GMP synthase PP-ATPase subunit